MAFATLDYYGEPFGSQGGGERRTPGSYWKNNKLWVELNFMKYYKITWEHNFETDPLFIFGEINDKLWETRRVEIYRDESYRYTDGKKKVGNIYLAENKMDEKLLNVNGKSERESVHIDYISKDEFERVWNTAKQYAIDKKIPEAAVLKK
jgi:hypothetical protein